MNIFQSILYPPPPSLFLNVMSVVSLVSLTNAGISEVRGKHLSYSKFRNWQAGGDKGGQTLALSGRAGMLLTYSPALAAALTSFFVPGVVAAPRGVLVSAAVGVHFFKRVMEVLFIHQYSGNMNLDTTLTISLSYFLSSICMIYSQYLSWDMPDPTIDLTNIGITIFLIGLSGNFYHHYLLSKLRSEKGDQAYKIPRGGLFDLVICPHYLFEIIRFVGICLISQTVYPLFYTFGTMFYLTGRSYATRKWYMTKFEKFPSGVKALLPYIF